IRTASSIVSPPLHASSRFSFTRIGKSLPTAARVPVLTRSGKRRRFSRLPPYSSLRRLMSARVIGTRTADRRARRALRETAASAVRGTRAAASVWRPLGRAGHRRDSLRATVSPAAGAAFPEPLVQLLDDGVHLR